ncbi:Uncharacterized protein OS=Uncultured methanogenic archaeon RC-I GN=UNCMA_13360 PE=4 SV=1 [Gemmata massiliana]|uniref:IraD/Gp25-like domain-containing protein n=1 Tax=Gemmata massiliana TaxID=1210884 RepID=A0A6P2CVK3_9BACT|nr:GPW/gp25 family protein [Gemmata massiliana]VTR92933.1 Uncharacterized protein OS=Uncultured methanogenic archaeon RC-I GN=UNCMA_13360 PE=4 SV=1 [Gemmata massiliana]
MDEHGDFGVDLLVLPDTSRANNRIFGFDFQLKSDGSTDLATVEGVGNLKQALLLRLMTRPGDLEALGHPDYGSYLFELIGKPNTPTMHNQAKALFLRTLAQEPRIRGATTVDVQQDPADCNAIVIKAELEVANPTKTVRLQFVFGTGASQ